MRTALDELFAAACARITRLTPGEANAACDRGALLVDIRDSGSRRRDGVAPGSLYLPRTVLEWRVDPDGAWRNPAVGDLASELIVVCDHGYSSAFAAAALVDLGYARTADVVGGFEAWRAAGLPVTRPREPADGVLPGLGPPD